MPELNDTATARATATVSPAGTGDVTPEKPKKETSNSLWSNAWRDLRRRPVFIVSAVIILLLLAISAFPGWFTDADPKPGDLTHFLQKPNFSHIGDADWFGYDAQGRSIYARVIYGARASIIVGVVTTAIVTVLGMLIGMIAGYFGGWVDAVLSRLTDIFSGVPILLGSLVILQAFTGRTAWTVSAAIGVLGWTQITRVMRGAVITVKQADYVQAARALGAGSGRILMKHVLPNSLAPVIVVATISLGMYISLEATLSYLGIGIQNGISWGGDISDGSEQIRNALHVLLFPAGFLSVTVLAFIMLGDAVRDALDPKLR
ncbi:MULTISPECIES: ABC transporter permease [Streptomyces]|uniref:ABC transporter permease n=1 Tax=Streptomyces morookaense TaxID=1970 RepID=A0A7Y7B3D7_STRMO|nr:MULTISPECIES: ABC transporter permease [Streptomyces]MCC2278945.1 ABC transporter permease [Streptomyces sp. ET3-23]NVK78145.1 ABC transporter permease [Streptomyces morookaense]GHF15412.1 peptide ABC transporter permease [Streptomyces morookaense]